MALATAAAVIGIGGALIGAGAKTWAKSMEIDEAVDDYGQSIKDIEARMGETKDEGARRIANTKAEGVMSLQEMAKQNAMESGMAQAKASMTGSSEQARVGASGVRMVGSAATSADQATRFAQEEADRKTESGNAGVSMGGLKLGTAMQDINNQMTLTTNEYQRQLNDATRKRNDLKKNKNKYLWATALGGGADVAATTYGIGSDQEWW